jgi:sporulation protein YlmC with PRC-barrel domain
MIIMRTLPVLVGSQLFDKKIVSQDGKEMGTVEDVIVDIEKGGAVGLVLRDGDSKKTVNLNQYAALDITPDPNVFVLLRREK